MPWLENHQRNQKPYLKPPQEDELFQLKPSENNLKGTRQMIPVFLEIKVNQFE